MPGQLGSPDADVRELFLPLHFPFHPRAARTAALGREAAAQAGTFLAILRAVRSARSGRRDWLLPSGAGARGTLRADKCDPFGLTVHVQRFRNKSCAAAIRAVVRTHTFPPRLRRFSTIRRTNSARNIWRYESRTRIRVSPFPIGELTISSFGLRSPVLSRHRYAGFLDTERASVSKPKRNNLSGRPYISPSKQAQPLWPGLKHAHGVTLRQVFGPSRASPEPSFGVFCSANGSAGRPNLWV